jgi:hypothetical protein
MNFSNCIDFYQSFCQSFFKLQIFLQVEFLTSMKNGRKNFSLKYQSKFIFVHKFIIIKKYITLLQISIIKFFSCFFIKLVLSKFIN